MLRRVYVAIVQLLVFAAKLFVALWLCAFYGLLGDIEGFERWLNWFGGDRHG